MNAPPILVWFRDDLRIADNPALAAAAKSGRAVVPVYILDDESEQIRPLGGASRWWLHGALDSLSKNLERIGAPLVLRRGPAKKIITALVKEIGADTLHWNRRYGKTAELDAEIEKLISASGTVVKSFNASLLHEAGSVVNKAGQPMKVFTPFWRALQELGMPRAPLPAPQKIGGVEGIKSDMLDRWNLEPSRPDWTIEFRAVWKRGERAARERLSEFVDEKLKGYTLTRDRPDLDCTSKLSPHLRFGEISPYQVWHAAKAAQESRGVSARDVEKFLSEIGWREFSYHLLHHWPDLGTKNFDPRFDRFPWRADKKALRLWQQGRTGYPLVDAGMRQLWRTGFMHNRVRMVTASFLTKHLLLDWRLGESWFWDTLVDADSANNTASWQWVAGSGADAAPYFRIFNPATQAAKFDPKGVYVRRWAPDSAGIEPIVDHAKARQRALRAFAQTKA